MGSPDHALIARIVAGDDHAAFRQLLDRHQGKIRGLLLRLTAGNHADADDMAQEVFIRFYKYLPTFVGKARLDTWLYRITYNVFQDHLQATRRRAEREAGQPFEANESQSPSQGLDFYRLLDLLSDDERWMMIMYYEKGYAHSEISEITRVPLGTVKSHILRGKEKLKRYVDDV